MVVASRFAPATLGLLLAACAPAVFAQGFIWPSATAPCNSTLQACVDGVIDGAYIEIAADNPTAINPVAGEPLVITRNLFLAAAPGRQPTFPAGIDIVASLAGASSVGLRGITLQGGGQVRVVTTAASGITTFTAERMRFMHLGVAGVGFSVNHAGGGTLRLNIHDNDFLRTGGSGNFALVSANAGRIEGEIAFNRIELPNATSSAYGIVVGASGFGQFDVTVAANRIRSSFAYGAICAVSNSSAPAPPPSTIRITSNVLLPGVRGAGVGICVFAGEGAINAQISNNTVIELGLGLLLQPRPFSPPLAPQPISGYFANNLIAYNSTGVTSASIALAVSNRSNLFFGNTANGSGFSAGPGTLTADPQLYSRADPYLAAASPAIDAGDPSALPAATVWPSLDADGHRRSKRTSVDIGAYEYGDGWFDVTANAGNAAGNNVLLDHPTTNSAPSARVFETPDFSLGGVVNTRPHGVYWHAAVSRWRVFNEDLAAMPLGAGYNLFAPAAPTTSAAFPDLGLFLHRLPSSGATNPSTLLDHASVNDRPEQIILISQNWNPQDVPASAGVYNNSLVTLQYYADNRWRIANVSGFGIPLNAAFNVYAQPPSPSAFHHIAQGGNIVATSTVLSHPLLDGNYCARIEVTSIFGDRQFDVFYDFDRKRWVVFGVGAMPDGSRFNVLFSPRQIVECKGLLFGDGFEA